MWELRILADGHDQTKGFAVTIISLDTDDEDDLHTIYSDFYDISAIRLNIQNADDSENDLHFVWEGKQ